MTADRRLWFVLLTLAGVAAWFCSTLAVASPAPRDDSPHLVVVPDSPAGESALARSVGARTVASYASFTLVEAGGDDVTRLKAAGGSIRDDMRDVRIGTRSSDPKVARRSLLDKSGKSL